MSEHLHAEVERDARRPRSRARGSADRTAYREEASRDLLRQGPPTLDLRAELSTQPRRGGGPGDEFLNGRDVAVRRVLGVELAEPPHQLGGAGDAVDLTPVAGEPPLAGVLRGREEQVVQVGEVVVDDPRREAAGAGDRAGGGACVALGGERLHRGSQDALSGLGALAHVTLDHPRTDGRRRRSKNGSSRRASSGRWWLGTCG